MASIRVVLLNVIDKNIIISIKNNKGKGKKIKI